MYKLLALNRSEIAIRILRAANELGLRTVAVYSQEDSLALHRFKADEAYLIGQGKGPVEAYLDVEGIVELAKEKGVDAIHPGYGFLSENPALARACDDAGITFIGPGAELLELLGDKTAARRLAEKAGIPVVPGTEQPVRNAKQAEKIAGVLPAGHDQNVANACIHQRLQGIEDHGFVIHGQQVLVGDAGQRIQARTDAAGQDYSLHQLSILVP